MNASVCPPGINNRSEIYHSIISGILHKNEEIASPAATLSAVMNKGA
jgi:hypothetical protein